MTDPTLLPGLRLLPFLEALARHHGVPVAASRLRTALRGETTLLQAGAAAGLQLTPLRRTLREVLDVLEPTSPWMAIQGDTALILWESRRGRVHVSRSSRADRAEWIPLAELRDWLGIADDQAPLSWILSAPAAPLDSLRSPADGPEKSPYQRLKALLGAERTTLWVAVVYSVVIGLLTLVVPIAVQSLVNTVAFGSVLQPVVVLTLFVFLALGFSAGLNGLRAWVVELLQQSVFSRVTQDFTHRLLRVKAEAFDHYHGPELVNRFFDVVTVQKSAASLLIDGLTILMQTVIGMVLVALYHPMLLAFDALLIVAMLFILFVLGRGAVPTAIKESKAKYAVEAWLEQIAGSIVTFKSAGGTEFATERSQTLLEDYLHYRSAHFRYLLQQIVGTFALQAVASSILLGIGGYLVIDRQLTLGQLVASELIVTLMVTGFTKFGKQLEVFYDLLAAMDKLGSLVDLPLERTGGEAVLPDRGPAAVGFQQLRYDLLQIPGYELRGGERLGLMGHHGCGKSTLVDLLFGLRLPDGGAITIDGIDIRDVPLPQLRKQVSLVRGSEIFPGTVMDNIRLGRDIEHAKIREVLHRVGLLEDLLQLPEGLETMLHPSGRPLSQVQSGLLMIARAICGEPRLLILDDALDQIDRAHERDAICRVLFAPEAPWTLICITERPDLLSRCNRLAVLEGGNLRDSNLHEVHA